VTENIIGCCGVRAREAGERVCKGRGGRSG